MIKSIELKNFQSHKNSKLNFSNGVNIIVGTSDSGKTAILRGLNLAVNNRPSGDSYRSNSGGDTEVKIDINNNIIERIKTDKKNLYKLNDNIYEAFGQDIPEEIKKIINFSDINFQYQMDSPFLLSKSSGEIAKYINQIINLEIIDKSLSNIEKTKREFTRKVENERLSLTNNQKEMENFSNISVLETKINVCENLDSEIFTLRSNKIELHNLINNIESIKKEIHDINNYLMLELMVEEIDKIVVELSNLKIEKNNLHTIINNIDITKEEIKKLDEYLVLEIKVSAAIDYNNEMTNLKIEKDNLFNIINNIDITNIEIEVEKNNLIDKELEFNKLMPEICPLCGSKVNDKNSK